MIKFERIEITPSYVPNTKTIGVYKDGELSWYEIVPNEGYLLHNKVRDYEDIDLETGDKTPRLGFGETPSSCPTNYDFHNISIIEDNGIVYTAYGRFEFFAKSKLI